MREPDRCKWYWHPTKRCKRNDQCTFYHDKEHPTKHDEVRERRQRNAGKELPVAVQNFGSGILRDRTVAIRALLRKAGAPAGVVLQSSEVVEAPDDGIGNRAYDVLCHLTGMKQVSALSQEIVLQNKSTSHAHMYLDTGGAERICIRGNGVEVPSTVYHGTNWKNFIDILQSGQLLGFGHPKGCYTAETVGAVRRSKYDCGIVVMLKTCAFQASKATAKQLAEPLPGVCLPMDRCAESEVCYHSDSLECIGFIASMKYLGQLVREVLGSEVPASTASLHFAASDVDETRVSPNHSAYELIQRRESDRQVELVLQCLRVEPKQASRPSQGDQEASSSSNAGLPLTSPPSTKRTDMDDLLEPKSFLGN